VPFERSPFAPTPDESGADIRADLTPSGGGVIDSILGASLGGVENVLDFFSRPFRSVGHLSQGNYRQAAEQFDPYNMFTDTPAESIRGADVFDDILGGLGLDDPNRQQSLFGIDVREIGGLGLEFLLDPLTLFGGALGKAATWGLKGLGRPTTGFLEGLSGGARLMGGVERAQGAGAALATGLERTGRLFPAVGAVAGGIKGATDHPDSGIGGAFTGALLGGALGAGVRHLPTLAKAGLGSVGAASDRFALRGLSDKGFRRLRSMERLSQAVPEQSLRQALLKQATMERELAKSGMESTSTYISFLEKPGGREVAAKNLGIATDAGVGGGTVPFEAFEQGATAEVKESLKWKDRLAAAQDKSAKAAVRAEIKAEKRILKMGGGEKLRILQQEWQSMPPQAHSQINSFLAGDPNFPMAPGKFARETALRNSGALEAKQIDQFMARTKTAHVAHAPGSRDASQVLSDLLGDLYSKPGMEGLSAQDALGMARSSSAVGSTGRAAREMLERRGLAGKIDEINELFPDLLADSLAELGTADVRRFASHNAMDDLIKGLAKDDEWMTSVTALQGHPGAGNGWVLMSEKNLAGVPKHLRELFTEEVAGAITPEHLRGIMRKQGRLMTPDEAGEFTAKFTDAGKGTRVPKLMRKDVHDRLFSKDGMAAKLFNPDTPGEFAKIWKAQNRFWVGWTLGPFASWVGRNIPSNMWNNLLGGVGFRARGRHSIDTVRVMNAFGDLTTGAATNVDLTSDIGKLALEILEHDVMASGFISTEAGVEMLRSMSPKQGLTKLAKGMKTPVKGVMGLGGRVFKFDPQQNLFSKTGFGINAVMEDFERVLHYVAKRRGGHSVGNVLTNSKKLSSAEAAESVFNSLGDFRPHNALTETVASVSPFIRWSAFNIPRNVRGMLENPAAVARAAGIKLSFDENHGVNVPKEVYPEWLQGQVSVPVGRDDEGNLKVFALNQWWPMADLQDITSLDRLGHFLVRGLSPFITEPLAARSRATIRSSKKSSSDTLGSRSISWGTPSPARTRTPCGWRGCCPRWTARGVRCWGSLRRPTAWRMNWRSSPRPSKSSGARWARSCGRST